MENSNFYIGQIFTGIYPPEAAKWCNSRGDCFIAEIASEGDKRRFQITAVPKPTLEEVRASKLAELSSKFEDASLAAYCLSSLGFFIDANPTSERDITGVLVVMNDDSTTKFCDYYNEFHTVTKAEMQTIQREIIMNGQYLYTQKWAYRDAINQATSITEIEAISIEFKNRDFMTGEA